MASWTLEKHHLTLKCDWAIARSSSSEKIIYTVVYKEGNIEGLGEVAFNTHYGETEEIIESSFKEFVEKFPKNLSGGEDFMKVVEELSLPYSLRAGIDCAFTHFLANLNNFDVQKVLTLNKLQKASTSFSLPIMEKEKLSQFVKDWNVSRFSALKIKISGSSGPEYLHEVHRHYQGPLRIDANEAFKTVEEVLNFCEEIKDLPIEFLEQPMPASLHEEAIELKLRSPFLLIADESITHGSVGPELAARFHGINVKLMKSGGYTVAIRQLREARELGMKTMIGCMIETSLGISSAMNIAHGADFLDLDGSFFLERDPYELIVEEKGNLFYSDIH